MLLEIIRDDCGRAPRPEGCQSLIWVCRASITCTSSSDARGGSHVHAKWLQDHTEKEFQCRLVATQLAIGEGLDVTQSTPPLMEARLLLSTASLRVDEHEVYDWGSTILGLIRCLISRQEKDLVYMHPH